MAAAVAARLKLAKRAAPATAAEAPKRPKVDFPLATPAAPVIPPAPTSDAFAEGEAVLGNFKGLGDWDEAVVVGVQPGGMYTLDYTDEGLIEENVPASRIQRAQGGGGVSGSAAVAEEAFTEGEAVLGNFKGLGDWDEAVVVGVQPGGMYTLDYTDEGLIEENVPASRIMRSGVAGATDIAAALAADMPPPPPHGGAPPAGTHTSVGAGGPPGSSALAPDRGQQEVGAAVGGGAGSARSTLQGGEEEESDEEEGEKGEAPFIKSSVWRGARAGYAFKRGLLPDGSSAVGYFADMPLHVRQEQAERERMSFSAAQLANWLVEAASEPPSVAKADRYFGLFDLDTLRVGTLEDKGSKPLFGSLLEWFEAERALLATRLAPGSVQVHLRVFLEPQQALRLGLSHASFAIDWLSVTGAAELQPLSSAILRRMGMHDRRPKRMLLVVLYKAERSRITQVWAEMDREGLALNQKAQLEDVLVSDAFDRALNAARRAGATGELNPQFYNYHHTPVIG
eukprot:scaffold1553_cov132-Isochrysis_galbana.AAC.3